MRTHEKCYRLRTSLDSIRQQKKIAPAKLIYISVEGDETERSYFEALGKCLSEFRDPSGKRVTFKIEVLRHRKGDGYSMPEQVIELMDEYVELREEDTPLPKRVREILSKSYTGEEIKMFLKNDPHLNKDKKKKIQEQLDVWNIDIQYRNYLEKFNPSKEDRFVIILDRDKGCHKEENLKKCMEYCLSPKKEECRPYEFYLSSPCFELWLLLHISNVAQEYADKMELVFENKRITNKHTFISNELSKKAHHAKKISVGKFKQIYLPNIGQAIENSQMLSHDLDALFTNVGTNMAGFFQKDGMMENIKKIVNYMKELEGESQ